VSYKTQVLPSRRRNESKFPTVATSPQSVKRELKRKQRLIA